MRKTYIGTLYTNVSEDFQRGLYPIARTLKAETHDLAVVEVINLSEGVDTVDERNTIVRQDKTRQDKTRQDKTRQDKLKSLAAWTILLTALLRAQTGYMMQMAFVPQFRLVAVEEYNRRYWRLRNWNNR